MSIKFKLTGFDDMLKDIEKAGGSIDRAVNSGIRQSAQIVQNELKSEMNKAGVSSRLINAMPPPEFQKEGNAIIARVGYRKGAYDPKNPSDGYKVVFLNYGTPNRKKHGKVKALGFINEAKRKASPKIRKANKEVLETILKRLQK